MRLQRNYYEILGLPTTATTAEIKRRYRELARKFHPDVVQDKAFGQRAFVQIAEAYKTLTDPIKRRDYNLTLQPRNTGPAYTTGSSTGVRTGDRLIQDAEFAFIRGRLTEAIGLCRQAIRKGQSKARAHAILGDIYRIQGRIDMAINEYMMAKQLDPANMDVAVKLNRLQQRQRIRREKASESKIHEDKSPKALARTALINVSGWGLAFFILLLLTVYPGRPAVTFQHYLPFVSMWSWNLFAAILADAILVGMLMCMTGVIAHPDDELIFDSLGDAKTVAIVPTGILLLLFSIFSFWIAAGLYLIISLIQESISRSVISVFVATVVIVLIAAIVYPQGWHQILLFAGNLTFIGMVIGWYIGAVARPIAME